MGGGEGHAGYTRTHLPPASGGEQISLRLTRDHRTGLNLPLCVLFIYFFVDYFSSFNTQSAWIKKPIWLLLPSCDCTGQKSQSMAARLTSCIQYSPAHGVLYKNTALQFRLHQQATLTQTGTACSQAQENVQVKEAKWVLLVVLSLFSLSRPTSWFPLTVYADPE